MQGKNRAVAAHLQVLRLLLEHGLEGLARALSIAQRAQHAAWPQVPSKSEKTMGLGFSVEV